jgi:hypothetical protein
MHLDSIFSGASMSHSTVSAQAEQSSNHSASTLGVSLTAAMLLAACGGGGSNPSPVPEAFVQPAWGSMAVMVTPGQASKVFNFPNGSCAAGEAMVALFNASLEVKANGDVSFKASETESAAATERFALAQSDTKYRKTRIYADDGAASYVDYEMSNANQYSFWAPISPSFKGISFYAGEGDALYLRNNSLEDAFSYIECRKTEAASDPITVANLTPAIELGEQRAANAFLKGATDVVLDQYDDFEQPRIVNGELVWRYGGPSTVTPTGVAWPSYSVNLSNGQWFQGLRESLSAGLLSAPAPVRVLFSGLLARGSYKETYHAASDQLPETRLLNLYIDGEVSKNLEITRWGNSLYLGDYIDEEFDD